VDLEGNTDLFTEGGELLLDDFGKVDDFAGKSSSHSSQDTSFMGGHLEILSFSRNVSDIAGVMPENVPTLTQMDIHHFFRVNSQDSEVLFL